MADPQTASWVEPAIVAALVAGAVSLTNFWFTGRRERLDRQRQLFAEAFRACNEYQEFPFIVRRRQADSPDDERRRISSQLALVQRDLNIHCAVLKVEAPRVAKHYEALVEETRKVAGGEITRSWNLQPTGDDMAMSIADIDLRSIKPYEERYLRSVSTHLRWSL